MDKPKKRAPGSKNLNPTPIPTPKKRDRPSGSRSDSTEQPSAKKRKKSQGTQPQLTVEEEALETASSTFLNLRMAHENTKEAFEFLVTLIPDDMKMEIQQCVYRDFPDATEAQLQWHVLHIIFQSKEIQGNFEDCYPFPGTSNPTLPAIFSVPKRAVSVLAPPASILSDTSKPKMKIGTNVHSQVAGISTSNALAKLKSPALDTKPGDPDAPWLKLTPWELMKLRKKMKKNAIWIPSDAMVARELKDKGRGIEEYNRHHELVTAAGLEPPDIFEKLAKRAPEEGEISAEAWNKGEISNRGMKLNEAKKLKNNGFERRDMGKTMSESTRSTYSNPGDPDPWGPTRVSGPPTEENPADSLEKEQRNIMTPAPKADKFAQDALAAGGSTEKSRKLKTRRFSISREDVEFWEGASAKGQGAMERYAEHFGVEIRKLLVMPDDGRHVYEYQGSAELVSKINVSVTTFKEHRAFLRNVQAKVSSGSDTDMFSQFLQ